MFLLVLKEERDVLEADHLRQAASEIVEQRRQIGVRRDGLGHLGKDWMRKLKIGLLTGSRVWDHRMPRAIERR